jgi:acetoacetate decarboxylase
MDENEVRRRAFAMPLTSPAYPVGSYRFYNREYLIITYRTDPKKLRELVPGPLQIDGDVAKFEFIRTDSTGFGDSTESGQVIPVSFQCCKGSYTLCMFLNDHPPIAGGRELWGFPKKLAEPALKTDIDTLVGSVKVVHDYLA